MVDKTNEVITGNIITTMLETLPLYLTLRTMFAHHGIGIMCYSTNI